MLTTKLLQPQMLAALGRAGHGSRVLVADGNYPHWTRRGSNAEVVFLNLAPGVVSVTDVLRALVPMIPIEGAVVMEPPPPAPDPEIWRELSSILHDGGAPSDLARLARHAFYEAASTPDVCLVVATGEQRIYANLLLTIGVVSP